LVDERARHELFQQLERTLGEEAAATLMEHLPPTGWGDVATRRDIDVLRADLRGEMSALRADFRGELISAMAVQTRTMLFSMLGTILTLGGLILAVARLG
jgi:hypothetical protein